MVWGERRNAKKDKNYAQASFLKQTSLESW